MRSNQSLERTPLGWQLETAPIPCQHHIRMKNLFISFAVILLSNFIECSISWSKASDLNIDNNLASAVQILETNKAMFDPWFEMLGNTPEKQQIIYSLYSSEMDAVNLIGKAKIPGSTIYLIPYINYKCKNFTDNHMGSIGFENPEDTNYTRSQWPVFSVILGIPDAAKDLKEYALDKKNPANFRFAAFSALRYLNESECKNVGDSLSKEFADSQNVQSKIFAIEKGNSPFHGAFYSPR